MVVWRVVRVRVRVRVGVGVRVRVIANLAGGGVAHVQLDIGRRERDAWLGAGVRGRSRGKG